MFFARQSDMTMKRKWLGWGLAGIPVILLAGSASHFAYAWCGRALAVAPFVPVNESVWEHLKLAFWPSLLYAAVEYVAFGRNARGFWPAKSAGILLMPLLIVLLFYAYTGLLGRHLLWLDISIFFVAVAAGQLVSCVLLAAGRPHTILGRVVPSAVVLLGLLFVLFTFVPPRPELFRDPLTGGHGLPDAGAVKTAGRDG